MAVLAPKESIQALVFPDKSTKTLIFWKKDPIRRIILETPTRNFRMSKSINFKGKIQFVGGKTTVMKYDDPVFKEGFEENLCDTMMASFEHMNFSAEEKKHLSRSHRKMINYYRHISPFALNAHANHLIAAINESKKSHVVIEANHYGAYICLAALYSGKLSPHKKVEFILAKAPIALFPKAFMKSEPVEKLHKVIFQITDDCWLKPFSSLYKNQRIKYSLSKKPLKKAA